MRSPRPRFTRSLVGTASALVLAASLAGCSMLFPEEPPATSTAPTAAPTTTEGPAPLSPESTATDNLPLFSEVMNQVAASPDSVAGRAYIDALVAAGFDKSTMQVTADRTSVDDPVDSLQFSVLWAGECLVGQVGPSTPAPTATVLPELPSGGCLIGQTRPIDW
ncbi:hypothetical protein O1W71_01775 [Microbacterium sp. H37-C3]|uniref:DUF6993 domain-containing protein n=1 Tax=Microbacterium sp. H37-C3 TaxID=3004354 RepID=UPI0022B01CEF|nr:hypothetical protein [Microbacterium sp. H37-C3]MCZ4066398.1 hypothetical protein [Microbacterium sp. H37-C3]